MGGQHLRTTYNRLSTGAAPVRRTMSLEEIMKSCRPVMMSKTSNGDARCFFEDETNNILYIFGPSNYIRQGFDDKNQEYISVIEFESGPYIGLGDEILSEKFAQTIGLTYENGIPIVSINYSNKPIKKRKKRKTK